MRKAQWWAAAAIWAGLVEGVECGTDVEVEVWASDLVGELEFDDDVGADGPGSSSSVMTAIL